jgi:hypothetical protein
MILIKKIKKIMLLYDLIIERQYINILFFDNIKHLIIIYIYIYIYSGVQYAYTVILNTF